MRLFVAIDIEEAVKKELLSIQEKAKSFAKKGRFSRDDQFHLTLRFIGETPEENLSKVTQAMKEAAKNFSPFELTIEGLGRFQKRNLSVLWVGFQYHPLLHELQQRLDNHLEKAIGLEPEKRPYTPHITLGRNIRFSHEWDEVEQLIPVPTFNVPVTKITLFESKQLKGKLRYISISQASL